MENTNDCFAFTVEQYIGKRCTATGLKEPALLQKVIDEVERMAVNEEIKQWIRRADAAEGPATATDLIEIARAEFCNGFCSK